MTEEEEKELIYKRIYEDREFAFSVLLQVENKDGKVVPFEMWQNQRKVLKYKRMCQESEGQWSLYVPKVRQGGITTACMGDNLIDSRLYLGKSSLYLNKSGEDCEPLFKKLRVMDDHLPSDFKAKKITDQIRTIHYEDTNSQIRITEAGNSINQTQKKGRSGTCQYLHITEASYIEHLSELQQGAKGSVSPNGCIVYESTMNGPQGVFYEKCIQIKNEGVKLEDNVWRLGNEICVFLPFYDHPEYREPCPEDWEPINETEREMLSAGVPKEAIQFRRRWQSEFKGSSKSGLTPEIAVKREYPWCMEEGFEATGMGFFNTPILKSIREYNRAVAREKLIVGIETPAGSRPRWTKATPKNTFTIWSVPQYDWDNRYLLFMDCADGRENSDFDNMYVLDRVDRLIVAKSYGRQGAELQVDLAIKLAKMYDDAWISWDNTGLGKDRLPYFLNHQYHKLFSTKQVDNPLIETQWLGLVWTKSTKPQGVAMMKSDVENQQIENPDDDFYDEALSFGYNEDGSGPEGQLGKNDDIVMTMAGISYLNPYVPPPVKRILPEENIPNTRLRKMMLQGQQPQQQTVTNW